jgi:signal transduction histidine kinase
VVRHSRANAAAVRLECRRGLLRVSVAGCGRGLPAGALAADAPGIRMMRSRALALGGQLAIESDGGGTRVRLSCPLSTAS